MRPELVSLLVSLVGALPGLIDALTPEAQATVREQLGAARTLLPAAGSVTTAVEAVIARRRAAALHPHVGPQHIDAVERLASHTSGALLSGTERERLSDVAALLRDIASPSPLAPPVLFEEPAGEED